MTKDIIERSELEDIPQWDINEAATLIKELQELNERLQYRVKRLDELYQSTLGVVNKLQAERELLLDRVKNAGSAQITIDRYLAAVQELEEEKDKSEPWFPTQEPDRFVEAMRDERLYIDIGDFASITDAEFIPDRLVVSMRGMGTGEEALADFEAAMARQSYKLVSRSGVWWDNAGTLVLERPIIAWMGEFDKEK